jgi:hypothetical protein
MVGPIGFTEQSNLATGRVQAIDLDRHHRVGSEYLFVGPEIHPISIVCDGGGYV